MKNVTTTITNTYHRIPKRYILSLLAFFGFFYGFVLRSSLSIAIVAMANPTTEILPNKTVKIISPNRAWSIKTQGHILSSFFYSYTVAQIPAGFLATRYGGRILFGGGIAICALLALFIPLAAWAGYGALIAVRVLQGFASGVMYPSLHATWSKWAPVADKSKLATFAFAGSYIGTFITMLLGGVISHYWSWEWLFYLSGIFTFLWVLAWFYMTAESPSTHTSISHEEMTYIEQNLGQAVTRKYSIPWKDILTSSPVWAIIAAHFGTNWCIYTMFTELPTFLYECLGYQMSLTGLLSALPWLLLAILVYASGFLSDKLIEKCSTIYVRKLIMSVAFIIIITGLLMITLISEKHKAAIMVGITLTVIGCGPAWATFGVNHLDIGAQYAGVLMGLSNSIGSIPGFVVPIITGYMIENPSLKREWNGIFIIAILISILALMFFTFFAAGELQPWATDEHDEYQHVLSHAGSNRDINERIGLNENNIDDLTDRLKAEIHDENNPQ